MQRDPSINELTQQNIDTIAKLEKASDDDNRTFWRAGSRPCGGHRWKLAIHHSSEHSSRGVDGIEFGGVVLPLGSVPLHPSQFGPFVSGCLSQSDHHDEQKPPRQAQRTPKQIHDFARGVFEKN
jgi:hypothetical protein